MEKDILRLKVNGLAEMLVSKGILSYEDLEIIDKSVVETAEKTGHKKEDVEFHLGIE